MYLSNSKKEKIKEEIISKMKNDSHVQKIVLFGSFIDSNNPNDIDIAIFENSKKNYISLALEYRKRLRNIKKILPIDIIPLKKPISDNNENFLLDEISKGEIIYEKRN